MYLHVADARLEKSCTERGEVGTSGGVNNAQLPVLTEESSDSKLDKDAEPRTSNSSERLDEAKRNLYLGQGHHQEGGDNQMEESMASKAPLRALTTLKWPYIPEAPSYPDPLARDDPKPLSLAQYEEIGELLMTDNRIPLTVSLQFPLNESHIVYHRHRTWSRWHLHLTATSSDIRKALSQNTNLPRILRALDSLRGTQREETLQRVLGVSRDAQGIAVKQRNMYVPAANRDTEGAPEQLEFIGEEEMLALKALTEAIEGAVRTRADKPEAVSFGLEWEDSGQR